MLRWLNSPVVQLAEFIIAVSGVSLASLWSPVIRPLAARLRIAVRLPAHRLPADPGNTFGTYGMLNSSQTMTISVSDPAAAGAVTIRATAWNAP